MGQAIINVNINSGGSSQGHRRAGGAPSARAAEEQPREVEIPPRVLALSGRLRAAGGVPAPAAQISAAYQAGVSAWRVLKGQARRAEAVPTIRIPTTWWMVLRAPGLTNPVSGTDLDTFWAVAGGNPLPAATVAARCAVQSELLAHCIGAGLDSVPDAC